MRHGRKAMRNFAVFVLAASLAVLGSALISQYWGGLLPCELCLAERWPWVAAIALSLLAALAGPRLAPAFYALLLGFVFAASAALAAYHVGVEQHWFSGPQACTAAKSTATTLDALEAEILSHKSVRCDVPQWSLMGISLAGFNFLGSLLMALLSFAVFAANRRGRRLWR